MEKQKSRIKRIHLVTDDSLFDQKAFYKVKNWLLFTVYLIRLLFVK